MEDVIKNNYNKFVKIKQIIRYKNKLPSSYSKNIFDKEFNSIFLNKKT